MTLFAQHPSHPTRLATIRLLLLAAVLTLRAAASAAPSVTLAWDPNSEPDLSGYKLYYGPASTSYTNVIDVGPATNATISRLVAGARYFVVVTAYNTAGLESDPSNEISYFASGSNSAPVISSIANRSISNAQSPEIPFTVSDAESSAASLSVSATSSNPLLIPTSGILLGGSGSNRTVVLIPALNLFGTANITLTVSDGALVASRVFMLTVNPFNDAPTISAIPSQTIPRNGATRPLAFTVSDAETPASGLLVVASSSNQGLVPDANVVLGGSGANRTVVVTPVTNLTGVTTVTLSVSDGTLSQTTTFLLSVRADGIPTNTPPFVSALPGQAVNEDASLTLEFVVTDGETPAANLTVLATSSNPRLVPEANIVFGGSGSNRTVTLSPARDASGSATVTLLVSDGALGATSSFVLSVVPVNDPPTMYRISSPTIFADRSTPPLPFTIADIDTPPADLLLFATSSNPTLLPEGSIAFGVSGTNRTVTLTPAAAETGTAMVVVLVNDGNSVALQTFDLTVIDAPPHMAYLPMQAEEASLVAPMSIRSSAATSNTICIAATNSESGSASFTVDCPFSSTYVVWARVWAPDDGHDSFHVSVDGGPEDVYDCAEGTWANAWQWTRVTGRDGNPDPFPTLSPRTFALAAGSHSLRFRGREANTLLDRILVSNDLDFVPQDPAPVVPPTILSVTAESAVVTIRWQAQAGMTYRVAYKDRPDDPDWTVSGTTVVATGNEATWVGALAATARFYTVLALPW